MMLYNKVLERLGRDAVLLGNRVTGYKKTGDGVTIFLHSPDDKQTEMQGRLLIGADGIHSTVRAQMHPDQPPIHWGGAVMWRGTAQVKPMRTTSSFIGLGTHQHRMVIYPISPPEKDGTAPVSYTHLTLPTICSV